MLALEQVHRTEDGAAVQAFDLVLQVGGTGVVIWLMRNRSPQGKAVGETRDR
jgi:hypothetical protein